MNMEIENSEDINIFKESNLIEENIFRQTASAGEELEYFETIEGHNNNKIKIKNNLNIEDLKREYIIDNIKFTLNNLVDIFNKKLKKIKFSTFLELREKLKEIKLNKIKAEIIFGKFKNLLMNCLRIKQRFLRNKFSKSFRSWKDQIKINSKLNEKIKDIQKNLENKYKKELNIIYEVYREKENQNKKIKINIQKNKETEKEIKNTILEFEEKEKNYIKNIQKLEEEKKSIQEEIENINQDNEKTNSMINSFNNNNKIQFSSINVSYEDSTKINNDSNNLNTFLSVNQGNYKREYIFKLDQKIKEYEKKLVNLKEETSEKDQKIGIFMNDMSDILISHEKNSNKIC